MMLKDLLVISAFISIVLMVLPFFGRNLHASELEELEDILSSPGVLIAVLVGLGCSLPILIDMSTDIYFMPAGKRPQWLLLLCLVGPNIMKLTAICEIQNFQLFILANTAGLIIRLHVLVQNVLHFENGTMKSQQYLVLIASLFSMVLTVVSTFYFHEWGTTGGFVTFVSFDFILAFAMVISCACFIFETAKEATISLENMPAVMMAVLLQLEIVSTRVLFYAFRGQSSGAGMVSSSMAIVLEGVLTCITVLAIIVPGRVSMRAAEKINHEFSRKLDFVRYVSHELRSPLNAICVGLYVLSQEMAKSTAVVIPPTPSAPPSPGECSQSEGSFASARSVSMEKPLERRAARIRGSSLSSRPASPAHDSTVSPVNESALVILEDVLNSCESMVSILDDLLVFNQIENETFQLNKERVEIAVLIKDAISPFYLVAQEKGVTIDMSTTLDADLSTNTVNVDRLRFANVLKQLISNAIEFTPPGGRVYLTAKIIRPFDKSGPSGSGAILSDFRRDYVRIEIIDGGPGVVKDKQEGLFRDSGKFDPVDFQSGLGTGMGLWISKVVMENHKGRIGVQSRTNHQHCHNRHPSQKKIPTSSASLGGGDVDSDNLALRSQKDEALAFAEDNRDSGPTSTVFFVEMDLDVMASRIRGNPSDTSLVDIPDERFASFSSSPRAEEAGRTSGTVLSLPLQSVSSDVATNTSHHPSAVIPIAMDRDRDSCSLHVMWKRGLIVDDVPSNRKMLGRVVKGRFEQLDYALNGQEAVENVSRTLVTDVVEFGPPVGYDIIFMDCNMPILDGMEATRKIRQMGYSGVILGVTGNGLRSDIDRFLASGADTVLLKPLNVVKFEAALNSLSLKESYSDSISQAICPGSSRIR